MRKSPPIFHGRASSTVILKQALRRRLHRQFLAAAAAAGSQNPAAVLGRHPGTEAVYLAALTLLGLVCTEHGSTLLTIQTRLRIPGKDPVPRTSYIAHPHSGQPNKYIRISKPLSSLFYKGFMGISARPGRPQYLVQSAKHKHKSTKKSWPFLNEQ